MSCLTLEKLDRLLETPGTPEERDHLEDCPRCRRALTALEEDRRLFTELRRALSETLPEETEAEEECEPDSLVPNLEDYEIQAQIHCGGQGVIYRGLQKSTRRRVAIKVLLRGRQASVRERFRFEREVDLATSLFHPNIVSIFHSGVTRGRAYFAMEYIEGSRLDEYLRGKPRTLLEKLSLFLTIGRAVIYAHQRGVIHRDLKPSNILVNQEGQPHILDFGLATTDTEETQRHHARITESGEFMGTLAYASPEQVSGDRNRIDTRTDIYSLGVILYEMLTGSLPYDVSGRVAQALRQILESPPRDPRSLNNKLDEELCTIVLTALAKEPSRRYPSAETLVRDLEHYLSGRPISAKADSTWYLLRKGLRRHRVTVTVASLVLSVLILTVVLLHQLYRGVQEERVAVQKTQQVFQDILSSASSEKMGENLALLEAYEQAAKRIEEDLPEAVDARAAVRYTMGETYQRLLDMPRAESQLRSALEDYRSNYGETDLRVAKCLDLLGVVLTYRGRNGAVAACEKALEIRTGLLGPDDPILGESLRHLAWARQRSLEDDPPTETSSENGIEKQYREALDLLSFRGGGIPSVQLAKTQHRLAGWLRELTSRGKEDRSAEVERLFRSALAIYRAGPEPPDPQGLECLSQFASFLRERDSPREAEALLSELRVRAASLFGEADLFEQLWRLAGLQRVQGDLTASEQLYAQSLSQALGGWLDRRPDLRERITDVVASLDRIPGTPGLSSSFVAAYRLLREIRGNGAYEVVAEVNDLAPLLWDLGSRAEAKALLRIGLSIQCRALGRNCNHRTRGFSLLAAAHLEEGNPKEALPLLEEARETLVRLGLLETTELGRTVKRDLLRAELALSSDSSKFSGIHPFDPRITAPTR